MASLFQPDTLSRTISGPYRRDALEPEKRLMLEVWKTHAFSKAPAPRAKAGRFRDAKVVEETRVAFFLATLRGLGYNPVSPPRAATGKSVSSQPRPRFPWTRGRRSKLGISETLSQSENAQASS